MTGVAAGAVASGRATGAPPGRGTRTVAVLAVAEIVGKIGTLAVLLVAVRLLTPVQFGSFSYALAFGVLLAVLPTWGLDALLVRQTGGVPGRLPGQYAQLLVLRTLLAVPVLVVAGIGGALARPTTVDRFALLALLVSAVLESYAHAPRAVAGVLGRQTTLALLLVAQRMATAVLAAAALLGGLGLYGLSLAYLGTTALGTAALFVALARLGVRPSLAGVTRPDLRSTARASVPLGIDAVVAMVLFRSDAVLLGWFHGDAVVAEYAAPFRLVETVLFLTWAVSRVTYPAMAAAADLTELRRVLAKAVTATAFVFVPFAVIVLVRGRDLLHLLFGDFYADAGTTALMVLAPTPLLFALGFLLSQALVARGHSGLTLATSLVATSANVSANLLLLPSLATVGAAVTTTGAYLLEAALLVGLAVRWLGGTGLRTATALPLLAALPAAGVLAVPLPVLVAVPLSAAVYVLVWWAAARRWSPDEAAALRLLVPGRSRR